jgi:two-component system, sensor histidine kinase LadS
MTLPMASAYAADRGPLVLTGPVNVEAVSRHLEYTLDPEWELKVADLVGPGSAIEMQPVLGPLPDFGYTTARIWLRLMVVNGTTSVNDWRFHVHVGFLQQLAVYRIDATGTVTTLVDLNEQSPFNARPIDDPQIVAPFSLAPGEAATLIVMYQSLGAARHAMSIETPESYAAKAGVATAKNFAFYGMMLVMIGLATGALATLRQAVFAAYAAYLSSILTYVAHADGSAFQFLWPNLPQLNSMAASAAGSGAMVFGGLFAVTFLQTARYHPVMHRVILVVIGTILTLDVILWFTDPKLLNRVLVYMIVVSVLTFLCAGLVAARTRFREVRFYLFSWGASLIPAVLFTSRFAFGFEPSFITTYDAIRLALILDALMMGLAIFDRYNYLRRTAMEQTVADAQRNLALSQRLAALEESYAKVTTLARQREESVKDTVHDLRQPMHALRLSLRQMFSGRTDASTDASQVESALGYMEKLVAERLSDRAASAGIPDDGGWPGADKGSQDRDGGPGLHGVLRAVRDMFAAEAQEKGLSLRRPTPRLRPIP